MEHGRLELYGDSSSMEILRTTLGTSLLEYQQDRWGQQAWRDLVLMKVKRELNSCQKCGSTNTTTTCGNFGRGKASLMVV